MLGELVDTLARATALVRELRGPTTNGAAGRTS